MNHRSFFISTAIPYVNAPPHLGFALEVVLADAIARQRRAEGYDVHFTSGTDDHSLKNVRAAEQARQAVRPFVDEGAARYLALKDTVGASYDAFVRTSADARHIKAVRELWGRCAAAGDLVKRPYRGLYCAGCEQFYEPAELDPCGLCPEHGTEPDVVEEENWFFRLSRYEARLRAALESEALRITPEARRNEVLAFAASGLRDVSVSRSSARARGWGIPVPGDPGQVIYVWFDALANYLASLGFPDDDARVRRYWLDAERRVHVVGKGITRFHTFLWPAILLASELPLPTDVLVHGYVTVGGRKIGKSLGNAIDPALVTERFGVDALRWFLLRHVGPSNDADVGPERILAVRTAELADGLGNLLARTLTLVRSLFGARALGFERGVDGSADDLVLRAERLGAVVAEASSRFAVDEATKAIHSVVVAANQHLARTTPWSVAKELEHTREPVLAAVLEALSAVGRALGPFLPETAERIHAALATRPSRAPILFPKT
jgi:methionyl-tRNA synthetase